MCELIVAPFAGAWIEIVITAGISVRRMSLRSPERGLKFVPETHTSRVRRVAPFAGAWIEIAVRYP